MSGHSPLSLRRLERFLRTLRSDLPDEAVLVHDLTLGRSYRAGDLPQPVVVAPLPVAAPASVLPRPAAAPAKPSFSVPLAPRVPVPPPVAPPAPAVAAQAPEEPAVAESVTPPEVVEAVVAPALVEPVAAAAASEEPGVAEVAEPEKHPEPIPADKPAPVAEDSDAYLAALISEALAEVEKRGEAAEVADAAVPPEPAPAPPPPAEDVVIAAAFDDEEPAEAVPTERREVAGVVPAGELEVEPEPEVEVAEAEVVALEAPPPAPEPEVVAASEPEVVGGPAQAPVPALQREGFKAGEVPWSGAAEVPAERPATKALPGWEAFAGRPAGEFFHALAWAPEQSFQLDLPDVEAEPGAEQALEAGEAKAPAPARVRPTAAAPAAGSAAAAAGLGMVARAGAYFAQLPWGGGGPGVDPGGPPGSGTDPDSSMHLEFSDPAGPAGAHAPAPAGTNPLLAGFRSAMATADRMAAGSESSPARSAGPWSRT